MAGCGGGEQVVWATMRAASEFVASSSSRTVRLLARLGMARICIMPEQIASRKCDSGFQNDTIPELLLEVTPVNCSKPLPFQH